jgi:succinyl-diaminopimelate desuccinylase
MAVYHQAPDDAVALTQALIQCQSVTPKDDGALDIVENYLSPLGFKCHRLKFGEVDNIYARIGQGAPFLCFAGHTDVVPVGDESRWSMPPFEGKIIDDKLFGRGASDMKGAVAAFMVACALYLKDKKQPPRGSLGFLITGDEEAEAIDGTKKVLAWMKEQGEVMDDCLVGEPSNPTFMGEAIKIGRRGSINMDLKVVGQQGHAANPHLAANPIPVMSALLTKLHAYTLDEGNKNFMPSNLEITSVDVHNPVRNVIPAFCEAKFNIRYNNEQTEEGLVKIVRQIADGVCSGHEKITYALTAQNNGVPFLTAEGAFSALVRDAVEQHTGRKPVFATNGGTSDARYIKDYARVVEFGLTTETIHKTNEWAAVSNIKMLTSIYLDIIKNYFAD